MCRDIIKTTSIFIFALLVFSCSKKDKVARIANEMFGREITFQSNFNVINYTIDEMSDSYLKRGGKKIIVYIDSTGCFSCRFHLYEWKQFMKKFEKEDLKTNLLFIAQTNETNAVEKLCKDNSFDIPVIIDPNGTFALENKLPSDTRFHTFLLDSTNKIILIGNPILSDEIEKLYLSKITK